MSKFIVSVFDSEKAAYEGSRALKDLHQDGSIVVFADAVITKDDKGAVQIQEAADEGPIGTATGMLVGGLLGALAGPAGMAVGLAAGGTAGWISDLHNAGVDTQFLSDVGELMLPGKSAVVAEISEGWITPLDTRMEELGGTVFRRFRADVEDAQIEREIEASNRELDELEAEWEQAVGEAKEKLQAKVDAAKTRLAALSEKANNKLASLKEEADAKIEKLNAQIAKAGDDLKAKYEKARDQLKADFEVRSAKLAESARLTKEALT